MVLNFRRIRLQKHKGLILFLTCPFWILAASLLFHACSGQKEKPTTLDIIWENERATGLIVPSASVNGVSSDSITNLVHVYLSGMESRTAILGDYQPSDDGVIFKPLIPFTSGLTYEVSVNGKVIGKIQIPHYDHNDPPELAEIYPSQDTLPENLLKFYFRFSHSMREGHALRYITLLKNGVDTVQGTFLDLHPELWNEDYTMITLWLDPGRIKRDLQPNQTLGVPLERSASYTLIVRSGWPDTRGAVITDDFRKEFFVGTRDSIRPDIKKWVLKTPRQSTTEPLVIFLNEPIDAVLLTDALQVINKDNTPLRGQIELKQEESVVEITPESPWQKGSYILQSEGRLEDLAGNNLDRLFDRDITKDPPRSEQEVYTLTFAIN
jgi:hypothetical protein